MDPRSRQVCLIKNGRNQAVRISREMELPGDEAVIYRDGQRLIIEPVTQRSLTRTSKSYDQALLRSAQARLGSAKRACRAIACQHRRGTAMTTHRANA